MESLQEYVPTNSTLAKETVPGKVEELDLMMDEFHQILFGGDQLTVSSGSWQPKNPQEL